MQFDDIIRFSGPLDFNELKSELMRPMKSGGYCASRIIGLIPSFISKYSKYIMNKEPFTESITKAILEWNEEKLDFISKNFNYIIPKAIIEICEFEKLVNNMLFEFSRTSPKSPSDKVCLQFKNRLSAMRFTNYKKLAELCGTYFQCRDNKEQNFNFSKLINRDVNLKTMFTKFTNGSISLKSLINDELKPQAEFMEKFHKNLSKFSMEQFCIFIITYDLKYIKRSL